jgi:hypothetical protein
MTGNLDNGARAKPKAQDGRDANAWRSIAKRVFFKFENGSAGATKSRKNPQVSPRKIALGDLRPVLI